MAWDLSRVEQRARALAKRADLEQLKANALATGESEAAHLINEILVERFPAVLAKQGAGRTPTTATVKARREDFDSGKDAYLWLVEQFRGHRPTVLAEYQALPQRSGGLSRGSRFARTSSELFPEGSPRASDTSYYAELSGGWFADTNINHKDKFTALMKLAHICGLEYPVDWDFRPTGGTKELVDHQAVVVSVRALLTEMLSGTSGRIPSGAPASAAD